MILDTFENARLYKNLGRRLAMAMDAIEKAEVFSRPEGRYELDGQRVFVMVQQYQTRPIGQCAWEAHRRYIDVQCILEGTETIGCAPVGQMRLVKPYDEEKDVAFFDGQGDLLTVRAGMFAIFHPHDAHMPMIATASPGRVRKAVFKVST